MPETPGERNRRIFDEATAAGEPVFVVRGQDAAAVGVIGYYATRTRDPAMAEALDEVLSEFIAWQDANPGRVKRADVRP